MGYARNNTPIQETPYRIQGTCAYGKGTNFENNRAYATFEEAEKAAAVQATNSHNSSTGNNFIIYKAVAVVAIAGPPTTTTLLEDC